MLMPSCVIYTEEATLVHPEDPNGYPFTAAIFWIIVVWVLVCWWFLY